MSYSFLCLFLPRFPLRHLFSCPSSPPLFPSSKSFHLHMQFYPMRRSAKSTIDMAWSALRYYMLVSKFLSCFAASFLSVTSPLFLISPSLFMSKKTAHTLSKKLNSSSSSSFSSSSSSLSPSLPLPLFLLVLKSSPGGHS